MTTIEESPEFHLRAEAQVKSFLRIIRHREIGLKAKNAQGIVRREIASMCGDLTENVEKQNCIVLK